MRPRVSAQSRAQPPPWMQAPSPWPVLLQTGQMSVRGSPHPLFSLIICWNSLQELRKWVYSLLAVYYKGFSQGTAKTETLGQGVGKGPFLGLLIRCV